ncbi:MAG: (2Fe-2S)-binding protein [Caulobacteraceae bacterium]|nr:(2Fe-2S)-binding protein [Caulobacteraceae bacterium]
MIRDCDAVLDHDVDTSEAPAMIGLHLDGALVSGARGEALLFALKRAGAPLPAICGGKGACGTCRIHVAAAWRARTGEPGKREARLLHYLGAGEGDRLSCQIPLTAALDGLELQTCADSKGDAQ